MERKFSKRNKECLELLYKISSVHERENLKEVRDLLKESLQLAEKLYEMLPKIRQSVKALKEDIELENVEL